MRTLWLDRIDIHIGVPAIELPELTNPAEGEPSAVMRKRVGQARWRQLKRFAGESRVRSNARMTPRLLKQHCALDSDSQQIIRQAVTELHLSARAYDRVLKVARTIADLAGAERIQREHLAEAVQYRTLDRSSTASDLYSWSRVCGSPSVLLAYRPAVRVGLDAIKSGRGGRHRGRFSCLLVLITYV